MELPKIDIYSEAKIAPVGKVNDRDIKKMAWNLLIFTAPILAVYFGQLAMGVTWKQAMPVAIVAGYGVLADFFKKLKETK